MSRKIPTSGQQTPLQSPFAGLSPDAFPDVPAQETPAPPAASTPPPAKKPPRVVLRRERAMRGGKTVVIISQLPTHLSPPELEILAKKARKSLGCGGHVVNRDIEIQGDQADRVKAFLRHEGFDPVGPG